MPKDLVINMRVAADEQIAQRADALIKPISDDPTFGAFRVTRSSILRMALIEGLSILESRYNIKRKRS